MIDKNNEIEYALVDPSKNITILVKSPIDEAERIYVAEKLMAKEKSAEQVGFVSFDGDKISLRMAGGEFCGNATMSAAAYYAKLNGLEEINTKVNVSGSNELVKVSAKRISSNEWQGEISMPRVKKIEEIELIDNKKLPVVFFDGIAHVIYRELLAKNVAEDLIKKWCEKLDVDALGIMFIEFTNNIYELNPLVYVKRANTLFWESACASGSSAVAALIAKEKNSSVEVELKQSGGDVLEVKADNKGNILLKGSIKFLGEYKINT